MKKTFSLLLVLALLLTLGGCASAPAEVSPETEAPAETFAPTEAPEPKKVLSVLTTETFFAGIEQSTTYEYFYDEQGFLKESITYLNGEESSRSSFQCDDRGNPLVETNVSADGVTTVTGSALTTYDEAGNLVSKQNLVTVDGILTDVREYRYRSDGKLLQAKFYRGSETEPYNINTYEYDDQGRETAVIFEADGPLSRTDTEYDSLGRKIRSVQTDAEGNIRVVAEYVYEGEDKVLQTNTGPDGTVLHNIVHLTCKEGDTTIQEVYMDDVLTSRISSTYKALEG